MNRFDQNWPSSVVIRRQLVPLSSDRYTQIRENVDPGPKNECMATYLPSGSMAMLGQPMYFPVSAGL